jgi:hypothetical protein
VGSGQPETSVVERGHFGGDMIDSIIGSEHNMIWGMVIGFVSTYLILFILHRLYKSIMDKIFWTVTVACPFSHAAILFILGVGTVLLPDIMRGLNITLPFAMKIVFLSEGLLLAAIGFIALCTHVVILTRKKALSENHEHNGRLRDSCNDERP